MTGAFVPTEEQRTALALFSTGKNLAIQAGAGTGKTRTLQLLAESCPDRVGIFTAFNKAIVTDAGTKMPANVTCATMHSLAMRAVGRKYAHRLNSGRMKSNDIARRLHIDPIVVTYGTQRKPLAAGFLAGLTMRAVARFCQSGDAAPDTHHVPYVEGIDAPYPDGRRGYSNNDEVRRHILPAMRAAWDDLSKVDGTLPFRHEHYLKCQPAGTMVTVVDRVGGADRHAGTSWPTTWREVPIEEIKEGDRVVSWSGEKRLGSIRRTGSTVTAAGSRHHSGEMVTVTAPSGAASRYTPEHICVVMLGELAEGSHVVYLMRRGGDYRIGRTPWRVASQANVLGIANRAIGQGADAMWVLSVHATGYEAALAEALAQHEYGVPGWQFRSVNEFMPLAEFWRKAGSNAAAAERCLTAHGRDIRFPLWESAATRTNRDVQRRPIEVRACNLMSGMRMVEVDAIQPESKGQLSTGGWTGAWQPVTVRREEFDGPVYSIEVEGDHTYVADGIVTHNCFERSNPVLMADFVMVDEAQDLSGVMISIVEQQAGDTQLVFVGDSAQSINEWMGAIDALAKVPAEHTTFLTRSFRFGPAVADVANGLLTRLGTDLRLTGGASHASVVAAIAEPTCILTRTNAEAVRTVLSVQEQGRTPYLMGGGGDVISFCRGAQDLMAGRWTSHQDLTCFATWGEVQEYVDSDPQGSDLALLVKLIDDFGVDTIITALSNSVPEASADVTVSTAHKSKGCEWDSVQLAGDFFTPRDGADDVSPPELKLLYVACTRARRELDVTLVPHAVKAPTAAPTVALDSVVAEPPAAIALGPVPEALSGPSTPLSCPTCGREDVVRGGLVGAHRCVAVAR